MNLTKISIQACIIGVALSGAILIEAADRFVVNGACLDDTSKKCRGW